jgi:hypothetical protein
MHKGDCLVKQSIWYLAAKSIGLVTLVLSSCSEKPLRPFLSTPTPTILQTNDVTLTLPATPMPPTLLLATPTSASTNPPSPLTGVWKSITNANYIRTMIIDSDGDLWTGGSGGVVHWNVKNGSYTKYTLEDGLANNYVSSITQATDGTFWFSTCGGGVSHFDGEHWTTYTKNNGLYYDCVDSSAETPDGAMWFGAYKSVTRYDGKNWTSYSRDLTGDPIPSVGVMAVAPDGTLWIGGDVGGGLLHYDGRMWLDYSQYLTNSSVTAITFSRDGTLWIGTGQVLTSYKNEEWKSFTLRNNNDSRYATSISSIAVTPDNSLWVGFFLETWSNFGGIERERAAERKDWFSGVLHFDGNNWKLVNNQDGLVGNEVICMVAGEDGKVWFGSYNQGVSMFDGKKWTAFQTDDKIPTNFIDHLAISPKGILWIGYPDGVSRYDGQNWTNFTNFYPSLFGLSDIFVGPDDSVWCAFFSGAAHFDGQKWTTYPDTEYKWSTNVAAISITHDGKYIFGSGDDANPLWEYGGISWDSLFFPGEPDIQNISTGPDGSLWFGTFSDGLYRYKDAKWVHFTESDGLIDDAILALAATKNGAVWVGSFNGVSYYDGAKWRSYKQEDGVSGNANDIVVDQQSNAWIGTDQGLFFYADEKWVQVRSGFLTDNIRELSFDPDGSLWIASDGGLVRLSTAKP